MFEGAAAQRAVDLVNALPPTQRSGADDDRLALGAVSDVLQRWGETIDDELAGELDALRAVVADLARLLSIDDVEDAAAGLNERLRLHAGPPRLEREPGWEWHLHVDPPGASWSRWLAASSAMGLAALFAGSHRVPWGRCPEPGCGRFFLDRGRSTAQRYCSTACATRARVRRHRGDVRPDATGAASDRS